MARVGHPHPSTAGSRSIFRKNGVPQYDTPRLTTCIGHLAQIPSRATQSAATFPPLISRHRADAALAIADEMDRNELELQLKHAMQQLSDQPAGALDSPPGKTIPGVVFHV